ncbi:cytochrome P450 protein [Arthrobacter sp. Hiyo4]|nr:cytochrome P450 protein [Arthrobacter sp. Hiyo4]
MLELLGLPVRDLAALKGWGLDSMELFWGWPDEDRQLELAHSAADFYLWLRKLVAESRVAPDGTCSNPWPNTACPRLKSAPWATSC